ncbi:DUF4190 domain-containing protein [Micromonospora okii]|uniref:DUF4190 domain-containing protein n=1 Tax=Micromonospora okii TaxID=1182970 RepID=UPI001E52EB53|nr:DUF4190 domain-containing protein [Micromonospora okii]
MSYPPQEPEQPPSPYEPPPGRQDEPGPGHGPQAQPDPYQQPEPYGTYQQPEHHGQYQQPEPYGKYQQYGPPPPGYGGYGPPGPARGTNVLAVLSLVFAFVFSPAGIVLGYVAKQQIRRTGEEGEQLATWGLILGYVFTALGLLICCGWAALAFVSGSGGNSY